MQIEYVWIALAVILVVIELWAINKVIKSASTADNKGVWIVVIVFVPLLGLIAWALAGPKHSTHGAH
ncbi:MULTISPECIES: PLD nuclease N-terminal domain-containing protein [unclassified Pseudomonas]|uniref:PLD nuclease N-terminal domain-containing protein n=1 Tax=unclassified Pseudomonas TaxID=196821 RepID=UPI002AC8BE77|nr:MULTISPECIES: PLD nuclease N-terminal domain-containing protein [unclassified Pseudomonas]MEB0045525.1 PLD nuclease N-terminal domain-containing protein [Pseudomonas sp. Dout3]MEB0095408.1 PLD nuclease N-terminal domain-containing protein [Pseudomonas sp. DC1.2]WPX60992.1 PLD nuclease N-terminal domain-containing protein [Pseudomonas sp. DC1.2]